MKRSKSKRRHPLRWLILFLVVGLIGFTYFFRIIRNDDGFYIKSKPHPGFKGTFLDTRNWSIKNYLQHPDVATDQLEIQWNQFSDAMRTAWDEVESVFDGLSGFDDHPDLRKELERLKTAAKEQYRKLETQLKNGDLDMQAFTQKAKKLKAEMKERLEELRKKLDDA